MINHIVEKKVDEHIQKVFGNEPFEGMNDAIKFLLEHPRKQLMIKNLCEQVQLAEMANGFVLNIDKIDQMCEAIVAIFARAAIQEREQRNKKVLRC